MRKLYLGEIINKIFNFSYFYVNDYKDIYENIRFKFMDLLVIKMVLYLVYGGYI